MKKIEVKWSISQRNEDWVAESSTGVTIWADQKEKLIAWIFDENRGRNNAPKKQ